MKVKDLLFISSEQKSKLGKYGDYSIQKFMEIGPTLTNRPLIHIYKQIVREFDNLKNDSKEKIEDLYEISYYKDFPLPQNITEQLRMISFEDIQYYVQNTQEYSKFGRKALKLGIETLADLIQFNVHKKDGINSQTSPFLCTIGSWAQIVIDKYDEIIKDWTKYRDGVVFPREVDANSSLAENLNHAIIAIAEELKLRIGNRRYGDSNNHKKIAGILQMFYGEGLSDNVIAQKQGCTGESVRSIRCKTEQNLLQGQSICTNIRLNSILLDWISKAMNESLFRPVKDVGSFVGASDKNILRLLNFEIVDVINTKFIIPNNRKGVYSEAGRIVSDCLQQEMQPLEIEDLTEKVNNNLKIKTKEDIDQSFVTNILSCEDIVEHDKDGKILLKSEHLTTDEQRLARIVYMHPGKQAQNIKDIFEQMYGHSTTAGPSKLKKYGIFSQGSIWDVTPVQCSIRTFVHNYAKDKKEFRYSDLQKALSENGYTISSEGSIRAYITDLCRVDNNDPEHFCHKDYISQYKYRWRAATTTGAVNWVLNQIKDYLSNKESADLSDLTAFIQKEAQNTEYENCSRTIPSILNTYSGDDEAFFFNENTITKNIPVFEKTNFEFYGRKGGKYPYFVQIRSIVSNEIKKIESGRWALIEAIKTINGLLEEPQSRTTILNAINNTNLSPINVTTQNIDGRVYFVKTDDEIQDEPIYEITNDDADGSDFKVEKEIQQERPSISYRMQVDWGVFEGLLRTELRYTENWMRNEGLDYNDSIHKFISYIRDAGNRYIREVLPQDLFEYWYARTDRNDRERYIRDLLLWFEGLLAEIKPEECSYNQGLRERAGHFDTLNSIFGLPYEMQKGLKGFKKTFFDLYKKRNKIAHGNPLELTSQEIAMMISNYTALYIFVVAKYV